jgi:hypothetical protein
MAAKQPIEQFFTYSQLKVQTASSGNPLSEVGGRSRPRQLISIDGSHGGKMPFLPQNIRFVRHLLNGLGGCHAPSDFPPNAVQLGEGVSSVHPAHPPIARPPRWHVASAECKGLPTGCP